ncbi:MAG: ABC transporter permease [Lachnospiraceae bacterium]|nr:ABC transporter permease [Lachnospiraceae bacterium]
MKTVFKPIQTLNQRTFKKNKGRNLVAVIAILMTTIMFTTLFTLAQSMSKNMVEMAFRQTGYDGQASFKAITPEQFLLIANHPDVAEAGESLVLGLAQNKKLGGKQVEIRWSSDINAKHSFAMPATGTMPTAADEIALDTLILDRLGIPHQLGETITLEWRKDLAKDEVTASTFTLCGFWEGNESVYASMAWVSREFADEMIGDYAADGKTSILGLHTAQVILHSDRNIEAAMENILADTGLTDLKFGVNLAYSPEMNATAAQESIPMYLGMALVFLAGYLIIYNIFQISVTADIQFYGKLKTLGTTTKQIKKLIYGQANRLCVIGIPMGLLLGWLLGMVLVPVLMGRLEGNAVSSNPVIFLGSALFAWLTVTISCLRPARLAGKVSPIEALRMSDAATSKKKSKRTRNGASIAGMAWANLGRNKKRTVTVICSLTLGLVLLSCFYAKNAAFDMEKYLSELTISDFQLDDSSSADYIGGYDPYGFTLNTELVASVEGLAGLEAVGHQYSHQFELTLDDETVQNIDVFYTQEMLDDWAAYDPSGPAQIKNAMETREAVGVLYGMDGIPLDTITHERHLLSGSYDAEKFARGDYVLAIGPAIDSTDLKRNAALPVPAVGSSIALENRTYTVMAVVYPLQAVDEGAYEGGVQNQHCMSFVIPTSVFRQQWPENTLRRLFFNVDDEHIPAAQEMLDAYTKTIDTSLPVTSRKTMTEQYETETQASAVMGNTISVIIALVGVLNFINSMVTAIVSRKKEFAMIQSVGMTKRQLRKMLICEGLDYAAITLIVSYIVSTLAVGIGVRAMTANEFSTFHFTLMPLMICTPILLAFAVLIPFLCFKNLEKQSIVERLRTE